MNNVFSLARFRRVLLNDALAMGRWFLYGALVLLALTALVYLISFDPGRLTQDPPARELVFTWFVLGAGTLGTSVAFRDMHHPLERYQYLMLPVSNLERFLSRYVLTGPVFMLYAVLVFTAADAAGNVLAWWFRDLREPPFSPLSGNSLLAMRVYVVVHAVNMTGAICFRSFALPKTLIWVSIVSLGVTAVVYVSMRIFYAGSFVFSRIEAVEPIRLHLLPIFAASWLNYLVVAAFVLWVLFVAYRCLRAHQVQDEL
jgi:hypothetical protein